MTVPNVARPTSQPAHPLLGAVLRGSYRVLAILDQGGMGTVFAAEHVRLQRRLVVKVLARHLVTDERALARFEREANIVSQLAHPNIVQIVDFDTTPDGEPYIVMERLEGETLSARLERERCLPFLEVVSIVQQVALGLGAAHRAGIVHRDLKPANIFLVEQPGERALVKLLDFGISRNLGSDRRLTGEHEVLGTPDYMSPEQALGGAAQVDQRADQYSLAVIAYEALNGETPFAGNSVMDVLRRVIMEPPAPLTPALSESAPGLWPVLAQALSKDPASRFSSATEFANALASVNLRSVPPDLGQPASGPPVSASKRAEGRYRGSTPLREEQLVSTEPGLGSSELSEQLRAARAAHEQGNRELAARSAERALELGIQRDAEGKAQLASHALLFEAIWTSWLPAHAVVRVSALEPTATRVLPEQAFLLSRLEGSASTEELIDLSPLPRHETLRHLAALVRQGLLEISA